MGRNEVTRAEWLACVEAGGCAHTPNPSIRILGGFVYADDPRSPVIDVSYFDVLEYIAWLNQITGTDACPPRPNGSMALMVGLIPNLAKAIA